MQLSTAIVLLTGGGGGIGRAMTRELLEHGASVLIVDRNPDAVQAAVDSMYAHGERVAGLTADVTQLAGRARICAEAQRWRGGVNVLINAAGVNHFGLFEEATPEQIETAFAVNVQASIHLCRSLLPHLRRQPAARIVNVGSVFGGIGYPGYVTYSATKFAIRGFTEALRRELAGTSVSVHYLAPRATRTPINSAEVERMNAELGVAMDPPERVARVLRAMLERGQTHAVVGWPEKLFVRLNAIVPRLFDGAIRRQLPVIRRYASRLSAPASPPAATSESSRSMERTPP